MYFMFVENLLLLKDPRKITVEKLYLWYFGFKNKKSG